MALTGHLSDLSLSELIEFFCNQRKTGQLKVLYPNGAGYFFLQAGSVIDARIGVLRGIDAVYYALTLPNAEFEFSAGAEPPSRSINQPWTQVVLEGLRRLDENIPPGVAFPPEYVPAPDELSTSSNEEENNGESNRSFAPAFFGFGNADSSKGRTSFFIGAVAIALLGSIAAVGVPAGWYRWDPKPAAKVTQQASIPESSPAESSESPEVPSSSTETVDSAATKRLSDRKARDARTTEARGYNPRSSVQPQQNDGRSGAKRVIVTVTYDESGRVTQASGGDANALRIARQKRFPPGKGGSATVAIPIN